MLTHSLIVRLEVRDTPEEVVVVVEVVEDREADLEVIEVAEVVAEGVVVVDEVDTAPHRGVGSGSLQVRTPSRLDRLHFEFSRVLLYVHF